MGDDRHSISDDPVDGSQGSPDVLDRASFAASIADALQSLQAHESSSVVGLVGPWGSGKTSVLRMVKRQLESDDAGGARSTWSVVEFNPWRFDDVPSLQLGFLGALGGALHKARHRRRRRKIRRAVAGMARRIAPLGSIGAIVGLDASGAMNGIASIVQDQEDPMREQQALERLLRAEKRPVVVIMDDLDRLAPDELLLVFKLIRLIGRLPYVHYLLAYDESTLLDVLGQTGLVPNNDSRRASDYLEKMIQLRMDVPEPAPVLCRFYAGAIAG